MKRITAKRQIGKKIVMPFTIPSGIVTTEPSCLERIANNIPQIGILTTKSIGPEPRAGNREPILAEYAPGCFINAVGLTNPGAKEFARKLSGINIPSDKFLLASIFGKNAEEFVYVAATLDQYVDGFELNLSCPHAQGVGMQIGQDRGLVHQITRAITRGTKKPVFAKLSPNIPNIVEIAGAAIMAGAYGITAINTVGPEDHYVDEHFVLTNKVGGISGRGIKPIGLKRVRQIYENCGLFPIIGGGGITTAQDAKEYFFAGASFIAIGSALAGMTEENIEYYFETLINDLETGGNFVERLFLNKANMGYRKVSVSRLIDAACDFKLIRTNVDLEANPGEFVFAFIPGVGEKPFSVMDNEPLTLGILERGPFTKNINSLKAGDSFYIRGPYGNNLPQPAEVLCTLVGGGCGIAALYLIAKKSYKKPEILLAAKDRHHIPYLDEFMSAGKVHVATEDGSLGIKGLVTDLFKRLDLSYENRWFYNCGPRAMVDAVLPIELTVSRPERIYSSVDYMTRCGIGICGSCADEKGRRTCVEGPFMNP